MKCHSCGSEFQGAFCPYCGAKASETAPLSGASKPEIVGSAAKSKKGNKTKIAIITVSALVLAAAVSFVILWTNGAFKNKGTSSVEQTTLTQATTQKEPVATWDSPMQSIGAGFWHTVGLKKDGTVVAVGDSPGNEACDVEDWHDIVAISAGYYHTVGLRADGTVVAAGATYNDACNVQDWQDIVAIAAGNGHTVGLKKDGTVISTVQNSKVQTWQNIVAISASATHTVGLKADGTVVAVGENNDGQCNVEDWQDIVAVSAGWYHTVGLKADGTVVAVGGNDHDVCNVQDWKDIRVK